MNILFLLNDFIIDDTGIAKKIRSESKYIEKRSENFHFSCLSKDGMSRLYDNKVVDATKYPFLKYLLRFKFSSLNEYILNNQVHCVYVRYTHFASLGFLKFLSFLKDNKVKIIIEIPTYPYDDEYTQLPFSSKAKLFIDKTFRNQLYKYVDYCVTFTSEKKIFSIPTINISNAVDDELIYNRKSLLHKSSEQIDTIRFVAVAMLENWHAYDRFIYGMSEYIAKADTNIHFDIVGIGKDLEKLKSLAKKLDVEQYVTFHGMKSGKELEDVLKSAHIGVDSLGRHRNGNTENNSLKSKEYFSFGLPIIKSHFDPSLEHSGMFFHNVPPDESAIEIQSIVKWFESNNFFGKKLEINTYCLEKFSWSRQMNIIFDRIEKEI